MFSGKGRIARAVCPSMLTCMFLRFCALFSPIVLAARLVAIDLEDDLSYLSARQALQDGLPAVAAVKAERMLRAAAPGSIQRQTLAALVVEAKVRAGDGQGALDLLHEEKVPNADFWEAQARVYAGDLEGAEQRLARRLAENAATSQERLLYAQLCSRNGHLAEARAVLAPVMEGQDADAIHRTRLLLAELDLREGITASVISALTRPEMMADPRAALLRAQALSREGRHAEAQTLLRDLLAGSGGGEDLHHSAAVLLAESLRDEGHPAEAATVLVQFLENTSASGLWQRAFDLLWSCQQAQPGQPPPDEAARWAAGLNPSKTALSAATSQDLESQGLFQSHALLLLARWLATEKRPMEALGLLEAFLQLTPQHPSLDDAMSLTADLYGQIGAARRLESLAALWQNRAAGGSARVEFASAQAAYGRGDHRRAMQLFETAASLATRLSSRRSALYNAALSAWRAAELAAYPSLLAQLAATGSDAEAESRRITAADLELDRALELAAKESPDARTALEAFLKQNSTHARAAEAQAALAEALLTQPQPDFAAVERALNTAAAAPSERQSQRLALTRLWSLERQGKLKDLTTAGTDFLTRWPTNAQAALVRMKMADAYYRQENFAAARTEYEIVAREHSSSPFADTALYFAGMASLSMLSNEGRETAINLWQQLAERGGPLAISARQQQAQAKRRAGQEEEALKLLDSLLQEKELPRQTRRSLLCEKAEILMLLGKTSPTQLETAANTLRELLQQAELSLLWRARAGYTLAVALRSAGRQSEALEACYDVVQSASLTPKADPAEALWYYRAGFFGIDLLEDMKQWEAAARLAEKLATTAGDRAAEARQRATKIRLEHFLWDGK
jgi:hypothetical protein